MKVVAEKILAIMREVDYLEKDMQIATSKGTYRVLSEAKVLTALRPKFIKHGLVMYPVECHAVKTGNITQNNITFRIVHVESGEWIDVASYGEGADSQDKGAGMSMTYALKNALLKTFLIVSGEDPDKTSSDDLDRRFKDEKEWEDALKRAFGSVDQLEKDGKVDKDLAERLRQRLGALNPKRDPDRLADAVEYIEGLKAK